MVILHHHHLYNLDLEFLWNEFDITYLCTQIHSCSLPSNQFRKLAFTMNVFVKFSFLNCHTKTRVSNLMHFQREMVHFFLQKRGVEQRKC